MTGPTKLEMPDFSGHPAVMDWRDILWRKQEVLIAAANRNDAETIKRLDGQSVLRAIECCGTYMTDAHLRADWKSVKEWALRAARLAAAKEDGA